MMSRGCHALPLFEPSGIDDADGRFSADMEDMRRQKSIFILFCLRWSFFTGCFSRRRPCSKRIQDLSSFVDT
jgi:hypothetical protein